MVYVKHPEHGNKHVAPEEAPALVLEGWVIWPRTAAQKAGQAPAATVVLPVLEPEQVAKRKPGRPRKNA